MRVFLFLLCFVASFPAHADVVNEFVQVQCLQDLNTLKVDMFGANGNIAQKRSHEHQEELWKKRGIRSLHTLIEHIRLVDEHGQPSDDYRDTRMITKDPIVTSCTLIDASEDGQTLPRRYDITIEPYFFNTNPHGQCGGAPTVELTLKTDNQILIDGLRFMSECKASSLYQHGKSMAMGVIQSIQLHPEDGYITLDGALLDGYEDYNEGFVFPSLFWLSDDLPITHDKVYGNIEK